MSFNPLRLFRSSMHWTLCHIVLCCLLGLAAAIDPVEVAGNKFFRKDGSQFFIKGVSYQLQPEDPLVDTEQCQRDIVLMKDLGVNAIRVYHVNATADHDGCMNAFADAGVYLLIDLDTFDTYIAPTNQCWSTRQRDRFAEVVDAFHKYDNVLGFFLGNENIATNGASLGAPFIKAAARDMKAYRDSKNYRKIPIGYSAADIKELRPMLQDYLTCGGNTSETIEFYGLNSYSWCDPSDYERSTYNELQKHAADFPIPIFFTETGCNVPGPRLWEDQNAIFGEDMIHDWSGAIIYEWIQEQNNYGIINYGPPAGDPTRNDGTVFDNWTRKGTPTPVSPDFDNLKAKWASLNPTGVNRADYDPGHVSTRPCPTSTEGSWWAVSGNVRLPALDETVTAMVASTTGGGQEMTITDPPPSPSVTESTTTGSPTTTTNNTEVKDEESEDTKNAGGSEASAAALCISFAGVILGLILWL